MFITEMECLKIVELRNLTRYSHPTFSVYMYFLTLNAIFKTLPVDPSKIHTESASLVCFFLMSIEVVIYF